jgi:tetratricopeptide (TPR) repeat protein
MKIYRQTAEAAQAQRHFKTAEKWYAKTFGMIRDASNIPYLASLYRNVGKMAQEQGNYKQAEKLYQMSHAMYKQFNDIDEENIPFSELLYEMSILKGLKGQFEAAGRYTIDSIMALDRLKDNDEVQYRVNNFKLTYWQAPAEIKEKLKDYWEENIGEFPIFK